MFGRSFGTSGQVVASGQFLWKNLTAMDSFVADGDPQAVEVGDGAPQPIQVAAARPEDVAKPDADASGWVATLARAQARTHSRREARLALRRANRYI